jgi:hypothetical protein
VGAHSYGMQAHWNAQQHTDEFVMDLLVSLDKLSTLVQELLVIEVGRTPSCSMTSARRSTAWRASGCCRADEQ